MKNLPVRSPFMSNYFCLIENYNLAFVAIAKNAVTYLKGVAISAKTGYTIKTEDEAHDIVGYSPLNIFLYPFDDLSGNDSFKTNIYGNRVIITDRPEDVDYVVSIDRIDSFLLEHNVFLDCKIKNYINQIIKSPLIIRKHGHTTL